MPDLHLSLPSRLHARVRSTGPLVLDDEARLLAHAYLPGVGFPVKAADPDIEIRHIEDAPSSLSVRGSVITVRERWNGRLPVDLWFLLYGALRLRLLENRLFSVHAACVVGEAGATLLVGHSGSGKTKVSLALLERGMRLFAGNKTVVSFANGLFAVAGTRAVTVRGGDAERLVRFGTGGAAYRHRAAALLGEAWYEQRESVPVREIVLVRLNDGVAEDAVLDHAAALHMLYPFFLDAANADVLLRDGGGVLPGAPPKGVREDLALALRDLSIPVRSVAGSLAFVTSAIA